MPRIVHFELPATDDSRATAFYQQVFGWQTQHFMDGYHLTTTGTEGTPGINGAIMKRKHPQQPVTVIIGVDNVDEYLAAALANGGTLALPKMAVPGVGYSAYFADPEGNIMGLWQDDPKAA